MKKQITIFGSAILLVAAITLTASTQQEKSNKDKKEQHQNQGKDQAKPGKDKKENPGNNNAKNANAQGQQTGQKGNQGKNDMKSNNGKNDLNDNKGKKDDMNRGNSNNDLLGYNWNRETFRDRQKIRNQEKVTICHKFNNNNEPAVSIRVSSNALKAHMNHGDVMGDCPSVTDRRWSDVFLRNRTDYYNSIYNTQEQVYYSRSILDYAVGRLTNSRLQLATMQNNGLPLADIQRKQATVVELEQNVSLLETVVGVAATLIANKLQ